MKPRAETCPVLRACSNAAGRRSFSCLKRHEWAFSLLPGFLSSFNVTSEAGGVALWEAACSASGNFGRRLRLRLFSGPPVLRFVKVEGPASRICGRCCSTTSSLRSR
jgi:hypothetical protein